MKTCIGETASLAFEIQNISLSFSLIIHATPDRILLDFFKGRLQLFGYQFVVDNISVSRVKGTFPLLGYQFVVDNMSLSSHIVCGRCVSVASALRERCGSVA